MTKVKVFYQFNQKGARSLIGLLSRPNRKEQYNHQQPDYKGCKSRPLVNDRHPLFIKGGG